jgi:hypothetical protein
LYKQLFQSKSPMNVSQKRALIVFMSNALAVRQKRTRTELIFTGQVPVGSGHPTPIPSHAVEKMSWWHGADCEIFIIRFWKAMWSVSQDQLDTPCFRDPPYTDCQSVSGWGD